MCIRDRVNSGNIAEGRKIVAGDERSPVDPACSLPVLRRRRAAATSAAGVDSRKERRELQARRILALSGDEETDAQTSLQLVRGFDVSQPRRAECQNNGLHLYRELQTLFMGLHPMFAELGLLMSQVDVFDNKMYKKIKCLYSD